MMSKSLYIVTQKKRLQGDFIKHIEALLVANNELKHENIDTLIPLSGIILREKECEKEEFESIVKELAPLCHSFTMPLYLNGKIEFSYDLALEYNCGIHTSYLNFKDLLLDINKINALKHIPFGVSLHTMEEAEDVVEQSQVLNISHILAGHIFTTDCKQGLEARGLQFLANIIEKTKNAHFKTIAIGGINQERAHLIFEQGADAIAIMSLAMQVEMDRASAREFLSSFVY